MDKSALRYSLPQPLYKCRIKSSAILEHSSTILAQIMKCTYDSMTNNKMSLHEGHHRLTPLLQVIHYWTKTKHISYTYVSLAIEVPILHAKLFYY